MSENTLQTLLHEASSSYREGQYEACVALLNDCLLLAPHPAILANRAIAHHKLNQQSQAVSDLLQCLRLDHLNYIAHYNLFSLSLKADQHSQAFSHLCCALSSALTFRSKQTREMAAVDRALYFASNNKEALLLKGLLHLEQQEYGACLQLLGEALSHESNPVTQAQITAIVDRVKKRAGMAPSAEISKFVGGRQFQLLTTLKTPSAGSFSQTIRPMVLQFNQLLLSFRRPAASSKLVSLSSSQSIGSSLLEHSISSIREDKTSNCITNHSSVLNNDSESLNQQERAATRGSYPLLIDRQSINWVTSNYDSVIPEQSSSVVQNWSSSASSSPPSHLQHPFHLYFTLKEAHLIQQKDINNLYSILDYNPKENGIFRTHLTDCKSGTVKWEQLSEQFKIGPMPSKISVRVFRKSFTRFEDELIGEAQTLIDSLGASEVALMAGGRKVGCLSMSTALVE